MDASSSGTHAAGSTKKRSYAEAVSNDQNETEQPMLSPQPRPTKLTLTEDGLGYEDLRGVQEDPISSRQISTKSKISGSNGLVKLKPKSPSAKQPPAHSSTMYRTATNEVTSLDVPEVTSLADPVAVVKRTHQPSPPVSSNRVSDKDFFAGAKALNMEPFKPLAVIPFKVLLKRPVRELLLDAVQISQTMRELARNTRRVFIITYERPIWPISSWTTLEQSDEIVKSLGSHINGLPVPKIGAHLLKSIIHCIKYPDQSERGWATIAMLMTRFPEHFDDHGLRPDSCLNSLEEHDWEQLGLPWLFFRPYAGRHSVYTYREVPETVLQGCEEVMVKREEQSNEPQPLVKDEQKDIASSAQPKPSSPKVESPPTEVQESTEPAMDALSSPKSESPPTEVQESAESPTEVQESAEPAMDTLSSPKSESPQESTEPALDTLSSQPLPPSATIATITEEEADTFYGSLVHNMRCILEASQQDSGTAIAYNITTMARALDGFDDLIRTSHNLPSAHERRRNKDLLSAANDANGYVHDTRSAQYDPAIVSISSAKTSNHSRMTLPHAQTIPSAQTTLPKMQQQSVTAPVDIPTPTKLPSQHHDPTDRRDHPFWQVGPLLYRVWDV
jgi:hypothetical protein